MRYMKIDTINNSGVDAIAEKQKFIEDTSAVCWSCRRLTLMQFHSVVQFLCIESLN